jgi:hypothetical protein
MILKLALDVLMLALLGATVFYCVVLSRRIDILRRDATAMQAVVAGFHDVAARAEMGAASLKALAGEGTAELRKRVEEAGVLRADMDALIARGESVADTLMEATTAARERTAAPRHAGISEVEANAAAFLKSLRRAR